MRVVLATNNAGKLSELQSLLAALAIQVVAKSVFTADAVAETGTSFVANALIKARHAAAAAQLPAIADDSGIEVDALLGAPGVRSARFAGEPCDDTRNNRKLLEELRGVSAEARTARYRCAAAFVDGKRELVRTGACEGRVLDAPRGSGGFGYDPLFLVERLGRAMAELSADEKNQISHRAAAFHALAAALRA